MYRNNFGGSDIFGNNPTNSQSQWNPGSNHNNNNMLNQGATHSQVRGMNVVYERALVPVTVKQILLAPDPQPEEPFKMNGKAVHQISVIGTLKSITPQMTHTQFIIDDYGAKIQCKLWASSDTDVKEMETNDIKPGVLVRVIGKVDCYARRKSINIYHMERIVDFNEMYLHGLECIVAHEVNRMIVNQHIPKYKNQWVQYMRRSQDEHNQAQQEIENWRKEKEQNKNKNNNNRNNYNRFARSNNFNQNNRNNDELGLDNLAKEVLNFLRVQFKQRPAHMRDDDMGCSIQNISRGIGEHNPVNIKKACKELADRGLIYDTIDDHYAFSGPDQNK